jgi:adenosylhomocysteine nucleosidase
MKKIAIIAAMEEEANAIKKIMNNISENKIFEKTFFTGEINSKECVLVQSGVGKVNAARTTQLLIDRFDVKAVINVGSAGALNNNLNYGDIVLSTACLQHDFDITCFNHPKGYITDLGVLFEADKELINIFENSCRGSMVCNSVDDIKIVKGIIATGDQFYNDPEIKQKLYKEFNAECDDMEGAAIAQVCKLCDVPFIIIRSITDKPKNKEEIDFYKYLEMASNRCAEFLYVAIEKI